MRIAYHFLAGIFQGRYGVAIFDEVMAAFPTDRLDDLHTYVYMGDFLIHTSAYETTRMEETTKNREFSHEKFQRIVNQWLSCRFSSAIHLDDEKLARLLQERSAVVYFDNIPSEVAEQVHLRLCRREGYVGCVEVDECNAAHWALYNASLIQNLLLTGNAAYGLWDGSSEESKFGSADYLPIAFRRGFRDAGYFSTNLKRSIFDKHHSFERAQRAHKFTQLSIHILEYIPGTVIAKLSPKCPDVGERLYSILKVHSAAETSEEYSQAACSCRRLIEYVSDCLFPPRDVAESEHLLEKKHYKNRLLAYCEASRKSVTNIDVICAATALLAEQVDKLYQLANKGTHDTVFPTESKRCIVRTMLLLDDIASLIVAPLEFSNEHLDFGSAYWNSQQGA